MYRTYIGMHLSLQSLLDENICKLKNKNEVKTCVSQSIMIFWWSYD